MRGFLIWARLGMVVCCFYAVAVHAAGHVNEQLVTVDYVVDGDTVEIEGGERVRLLGIDAPENKRTRKSKDGKRLVPAQPFFLEAKNHLRDLVADQRVKMRIGEEATGPYGRTLAYLYLPDGTDVQQELIRRGYAMVAVYPPNTTHLPTYGKTEAEACRAGIGLWGDAHFALQELENNTETGTETGAEIRLGRGRIVGVVTAVEHTGTNIRIILANRVTLLIHRGSWRKFWPGQDANNWLGTRIIARGKILATSKKSTPNKTMRIRHPFNLRSEICADGQV